MPFFLLYYYLYFNDKSKFKQKMKPKTNESLKSETSNIKTKKQVYRHIVY